MILADASIRWELSNGNIGVDPEPTDEQIQPASLDVRLGREMYDIGRDHRLKKNVHTLKPGRRYLGHTKEKVDLPDDIAAQLAGRSSVGRRGIIVHKTAGWVDPGFTGSLTLELMNLGNEPIQLKSGNRVAQLVFLPLDQPSEGYDGGYQNQSGATEAYDNGDNN